MRTNQPQIPMNGVPVVLKSHKGPLGLRMTNESGEFTFEFQEEGSITLEVEVSPNEWVLLISPPLESIGRGGDHAASLKEIGPVDTSILQGSKLQSKKGRPV